MTGAIEFLMAWKDICDKHIRCEDCPITACSESESNFPPIEADYNQITELVRQVMAESRKKVDAE